MTNIALLKPRALTLFNFYLGLISAIGFFLLAWGVVHIPSYEPRLNYFLLIVLAAVSAIPTTSVAVSGDSGITYSVGSVVSLAAIPFWGPAAAIPIVAVFSLCVWLVKPANKTTWKKSWPQLAFNTGMHAIATFGSGWVLLSLRGWLGPDTIWGETIPWLPAAAVFEEINLWLLIGVLRLQPGAAINPVAVWKEELWATYIDTLLLTLGGGILAFALQHYQWLGIVIFFLPTLLSSYAFQLYVGQMQAHLNNLEQIVADRTKDLAELNRQKDAFLAVLTHDMMTPLTSIQLCAEELADDPAAALENPDLITFMLRSQQTLFRMMRNILDIEKLQSGRGLAMYKVDCELAPLITEVMQILRPEAAEKNIVVRQQLPSYPLFLHADRQQLERILLNLVSNAVKYTPSGGWVSVAAHLESNFIFIQVQDSGYGIPAAELPYIFDRYRRVEQLKDKATGSGLGLAITKALVEEHAGVITVTSEEGKGSTFTIKLPV